MSETAKLVPSTATVATSSTDLDDGKFKGGRGGWGEVLRMLPSITVPPVVAVPVAPLLIAWWCGIDGLPYLDVMSDIGLNTISFVILITGMAFFSSVTLLLPGFFRIWDDYLIHKSGKIERTAETERFRNFRWNASFLLSNLAYFVTNIVILFSIFNLINKNSGTDKAYGYAFAVLWSVGSCLHLVLCYQKVRSSFSEAWRVVTLQSTSPRKFEMAKGIFRYTQGKFLKRKYIAVISATPDGASQAEDVHENQIFKLIDGGKSKEATEDVDPLGIVTTAFIDFSGLFCFFLVAENAISSIGQGGSDSLKITTEYVSAFALPFFPAIGLAASTSWADDRSPWAALKAVFITFALLILIFPTAPKLIDTMARTVGFGGGRSAYLYLKGHAACSHPNLVGHVMDCGSETAIRSVRLPLLWMGPGKVIVGPSESSFDQENIVIDRSDVPAYDLVKIPPSK